MRVNRADTRTGEFLRTADEIGRCISQRAIWHGNRCNWVGAEPLERFDEGLQVTAAYRALGPDLYAGTSGVALFLSELYAVTGDSEARQTSLGAIRQALSRIDSVPPHVRLGLFAGWIGIAFAAARMGIVLAEAELLDRARALVLRSVSEGVDEREFDLISGRAGAIAALIVLNHILDDSFFLDFAVRLGDELLQTAEKADNGYSWKSPGLRNRQNLTGFSHGTAGAGYSLLELFSATEDTKYREAAELAFRYERSWFNPEAGNWPDFREDPYSSSRRARPLSFATFWCHGAPGIALSRLRAYEILKDEIYKAEAIVALDTTRKSIEFALNAGTGNYSLCHGLVGNVEALLYARHVLGLDYADGVTLGWRVAAAGIKRYAMRRMPWPCGTHSGETPNLMLGLAGIGHFYLRLHHPATPSILVLRRDG